jgi:predicted DNA-binding antitoxin AbrB/MazE fold protein
MKTIHAIFENGVFRPTEPVDLPEGSEVTVEPKSLAGADELSPRQKRIHELLRQPVDTGDPFLSERHDEHQP